MIVETSAPAAAGALPLWLVTDSTLQGWLAEAGSEIANWVRANGFQAEKQRVLMLPGASGNPAGAVVGARLPRLDQRSEALARRRAERSTGARDLSPRHGSGPRRGHSIHPRVARWLLSIHPVPHATYRGSGLAGGSDGCGHHLCRGCRFRLFAGAGPREHPSQRHGSGGAGRRSHRSRSPFRRRRSRSPLGMS